MLRRALCGCAVEGPGASSFGGGAGLCLFAAFDGKLPNGLSHAIVSGDLGTSGRIRSRVGTRCALGLVEPCAVPGRIAPAAAVGAPFGRPGADCVDLLLSL